MRLSLLTRGRNPRHYVGDTLRASPDVGDTPDPVFPNDNENHLVPLCLTMSEFTRLMSAADVGAELLYNDEALAVVAPLVRARKFLDDATAGGCFAPPEEGEEMCCGESATTNALLGQLVTNQLGNNPAVFAPDAPTMTFTTDPRDTTPLARQARRDALCLAVRDFVVGGLRAELQNATNEAAGKAAALGLLGSLVIGVLGPPIGAAVALALSAPELAAFGDEAAVRRLICHIYQRLRNKAPTRENFQNAIDETFFAAGSNAQRLAVRLRRFMNTAGNYHAFMGALGNAKARAAAEPSLSDCECLECRDAAVWDVPLTDYANSGGISAARIYAPSIRYDDATNEYVVRAGLIRINNANTGNISYSYEVAVDWGGGVCSLTTYTVPLSPPTYSSAQIFINPDGSPNNFSVPSLRWWRLLSAFDTVLPSGTPPPTAEYVVRFSAAAV